MLLKNQNKISHQNINALPEIIVARVGSDWIRKMPDIQPDRPFKRAYKKCPLKSKHIKSKIAKNKKRRYKYSVGKSYELNNLI